MEQQVRACESFTKKQYSLFPSPASMLCFSQCKAIRFFSLQLAFFGPWNSIAKWANGELEFRCKYLKITEKKSVTRKSDWSIFTQALLIHSHIIYIKWNFYLFLTSQETATVEQKITCIQKTYFCRCRWLCPFALPLLTKHSLQLQKQGRQWKGRLVNGRGGHKLPMLSMSRQKLKGTDQMNIHCVYVSKMNVKWTKEKEKNRFCSIKCVKIRSLPFNLTKHTFSHEIAKTKWSIHFLKNQFLKWVYWVSIQSTAKRWKYRAMGAVIKTWHKTKGKVNLTKHN